MTAAFFSAGRDGALEFDYRGTITLGVISRLERYMHKRYGGTVEAVQLFEEDTSGIESMEEMWRRLLGRKPAILVADGRAVYANRSPNRELYAIERLEIEVYFLSQHMHSRGARVAGYGASVSGQGGDPGAWRMMADARRLLPDFSVAKFAPMQLDDESPGPRGLGGVIWQQTWVTRGHVDHVPLPENVHPPVSKVQTTLAIVEETS